jgi:protein involved in sex pheromone biosynthesis
MKALLIAVAAAVLGLSACDAAEGENDEERSEQRDRGEDDD